MKIVVAGEALVDLVIGVDGTVVAKLGGGPFNVARTIGRLGGDVSFLGALSTDRFGEQLLQCLVADDVRSDAVLRTDAPTTLAAAELDGHGSATYRFYIDGTSAPALDHVPAALVSVALVPAESVRAVHVGTLGLVLEPMATTLAEYVGSLADDVLVMSDPNCRPRIIHDRAAYLLRLTQVHRHTHVVKISTDDARYLDPQVEPIEFSQSLLHTGVRAVLLTGGGDQAWVVSPGGATPVPVVEVEVADTIGAGDSFGGAFLAWWIGAGLGVDDLADHDALVAATAAAQQVAAVTCSRMGAHPPRRAELAADWGRWTRS